MLLSKRLPIVVAIDLVALEKGFKLLDESEYDIAKYIINRLFQDIQNNRYLYDAVEIYFIYNGETEKTDFCGVNEYILKGAEACHSAADMIHLAYEKIYQRLNILQNFELGYYRPLVIFIGNKDFVITDKDDCRKGFVNTVIINIGKTSWNPIENSNIETFSVATMAIAERFDIKTIIRYIRDGYRLYSDINQDQINFHNYCGTLRKELILENDAPSSENIAQDEIINTICADMKALIADLIEE